MTVALSDAQAMDLAQQAAHLWGARHDAPQPRLIRNRENAVFEIALPGGPAALRLHRPGYQSQGSIASELWWQSALAAEGLAVPTALPTLAGDLVAQLAQGRLASCIAWAKGDAIGEGGVPLTQSMARQCALHADLGQMLAEMHTLTDGMTLPANFTRHRWDLDGLLGETPFWDRFWEHPGLTQHQAAMLKAARSQLHADFTSYIARGADIGLIHADVLRENVLDDDGALTLIDFDDCGIGFRLYDLGTALSQNLTEPHLPQIADALISGYSRLRPLSTQDIGLVAGFTLLRTLASVGWTMSRLPADHPGARAHIARAVRASDIVLGGGALLGR